MNKLIAPQGKVYVKKVEGEEPIYATQVHLGMGDREDNWELIDEIK